MAVPDEHELSRVEAEAEEQEPKRYHQYSLLSFSPSHGNRSDTQPRGASSELQYRRIYLSRKRQPEKISTM